MKLVKKTNAYKILQRRDGRYAVASLLGHAITGDEKVNILVTEKLIKQSTAKPAAPVEDTDADEPKDEPGDE